MISLILFCQVFYLCRGPQYKYAGRCCAGRCEKIRTWIRCNFLTFRPSATEVREKCITIVWNHWSAVTICWFFNLPRTISDHWRSFVWFWPLNDDTKILTETHTETFFYDTKFSKTETETFFRDQIFLKPKLRLFFRDQIFWNRNPQKFGKSLKTET